MGEKTRTGRTGIQIWLQIRLEVAFQLYLFHYFLTRAGSYCQLASETQLASLYKTQNFFIVCSLEDYEPDLLAEKFAENDQSGVGAVRRETSAPLNVRPR
jgi:hypothetical protein